MRSPYFILLGLSLLLASCATGTIAQLKDVKVDLKDEKVDGGIDKAIRNYELYLEKSPESDKTPESLRRLADLKLKKDLDVPESAEDGRLVATPESDKSERTAVTDKTSASKGDAGKGKPLKPGKGAKEAISDFEQRTTAAGNIKPVPAVRSSSGRAGADMGSAGTKQAIALYQKLLSEYPDYELNDQALYQLARAYDELGNVDEAMNMMNRLVRDYPKSQYIEEVQFRRGEHFYVRKQFADANAAYKALVDKGAASSYYELALYKLGWTYYKQDMYEEATRRFASLLDHKLASGTDLDRPRDSFDAKRIEDTFRVMSLSFSNLGGADAVVSFFDQNGKRAYETGVYKDLGDFYLDKLRYSDAAAAFKAFVKSNPQHKMSPTFDMWAIDSFKKGGFFSLVIESKKGFIGNYGLKAPYWKRFDIAAFKDVSEYVKSGMKELANYYHAQYQDKRLAANKDENLQEAVKWYREFLDTYPKDGSAPAMHYQLAELLHENKWYGKAGIEYEHIAYDYPAHEKSAAAGYAAILAYRESLAHAALDERDRIKHDVIRSSLKFAEQFPQHEKAVLVMSAAVDDIYAMKDYAHAAATARKLIARFSGAKHDIRRNAWLIFAHSSFELGIYKDAEEGYLSALGLSADNDSARPGIIENLAASFYKQGELANKQGNHKLASTYFLLVGIYVPTAKIRPVADFDAATAMIQLKTWDAAANMLLAFRANFPGHMLQPEVSKKLAFVYKESGKPSLAAAEYERVGAEDGDVVIRREALELAAELYVQANEMDKAYPVYRRYLHDFPKPPGNALEIRNKIAVYLKARNDTQGYFSELRQIVDADAHAGSERTDRTRYLGAMAALAMAEQPIRYFSEIRLVKPFAKNLAKKQDAMKTAKEQLEKLFDYEVVEVTSAATFYLADMYFDFSRALVESERPSDLNALEKEQYELSIEEQAYPFEEKTIQVHQQNLELMTRGIFNPWVEKSIEKLAKLVPARYAKFEESSGYIEDIDTAGYAALVDPKKRVMPAPVPGAAKAVDGSGGDAKKGQ